MEKFRGSPPCTGFFRGRLLMERFSWGVRFDFEKIDWFGVYVFEVMFDEIKSIYAFVIFITLTVNLVG